jgi:hypothetical protein
MKILIALLLMTTATPAFANAGSGEACTHDLPDGWCYKGHDVGLPGTATRADCAEIPSLSWRFVWVLSYAVTSIYGLQEFAADFGEKYR